jgi:hypothetical protein
VKLAQRERLRKSRHNQNFEGRKKNRFALAIREPEVIYTRPLMPRAIEKLIAAMRGLWA